MVAWVRTEDRTVQAVLAHFCGDGCHGFGESMELCESRGDCVIVVRCPQCGTSFTLDDDQYDQLAAWSTDDGQVMACGIEPLSA